MTLNVRWIVWPWETAHVLAPANDEPGIHTLCGLTHGSVGLGTAPRKGQARCKTCVEKARREARREAVT